VNAVVRDKSHSQRAFIKGLAALNGKTLVDVATILGRLPQSLNKTLNSESLSLSDAEKIAESLGYEIDWRKKEK
jgi:hypothetical protein